MMEIKVSVADRQQSTQRDHLKRELDQVYIIGVLPKIFLKIGSDEDKVDRYVSW